MYFFTEFFKVIWILYEHFFVKRCDLLKELAWPETPLVVAEIGVWKGDFSAVIPPLQPCAY